MDKLKRFVVISLFWSTAYLALDAAVSLFGLNRIKLVDEFLFGIIGSLFLLSIAYKGGWFKRMASKRLGVAMIYLVLASAMFLLAYAFNVSKRGKELYEYVMDRNKRGWKGKMHESDTTLGFKTIKGLSSYIFIAEGDTVFNHHDKDGFRVAYHEKGLQRQPGEVDILFLGDSFTYGEFNDIEESFVHMSSQRLGFTSINAGVCGYGLAQMYLKARELIPRYRPRQVVIQYSEWLLDRGLNIFAPSYHSRIPVPYFRKVDDSIVVRSPPYMTMAYNLDFQKMQSEYRNALWLFILSEAVPFYLRHDIQKVETDIKLRMGRLERPNLDKRELARRVYPELIELVRSYGGIPYILYVDEQFKIPYIARKGIPADFTESIGNAVLIDAVRDQNEYLKQNPGLNPSLHFVHWRNKGKDTTVIDHHPNRIANTIIAESIVKAIRGYSSIP